MDQFYSINERVVAIVIRLTKGYRLQIIQAYATTSTYEYEAVDSFYEDVELAMRKVNTPYSIVMGYFNAKIGRKRVGNARWENWIRHPKQSR